MGCEVGKKNRADPGFTLIEVIIAFAIFTIVAGFVLVTIVGMFCPSIKGSGCWISVRQNGYSYCA